jgi:hypothetical protein
LLIRVNDGTQLSEDLQIGDSYLVEGEGGMKAIYIEGASLGIQEKEGSFEISPKINVKEIAFKPFSNSKSLNNLFAKGFFGYSAYYFDKESSFSNPDVLRIYSGRVSHSNVEWAQDFPSTLDSNTFYALNLPRLPDNNPSGYELFYDFFLPKRSLELEYSQTPYAYLVSDESPWRGIPYEGVEKIYNFYDKYDPQATTWINFAYADEQGDLERYKNNIKLYGERADIVGFDCYPSFNNFGSAFDQTFAAIKYYKVDTIGNYVELFKDVFGENKKMWFVSQAYGEKSRDYEILKRDLKFMPYQAIIHGTDGIMFFGLHVRGWSTIEALPEIVHPIINELDYLESYLVSSPTKTVVAPLDQDYLLTGYFDGIEYSIFRKDTKFVILAVNRKDQNVLKNFNSDNLGFDLSKVSSLSRFYYLPSPKGSTNLAGTKVIKNQEFSSEGFVINFSPYEVYILEGEMDESTLSLFIKNVNLWVKKIFS